MQTSSQLNKQITNQECKQSDFKQTDIGAGEQETQQEKQHKNVQQVSYSPKKEKTKCKKKKIGSYSYCHIIDYSYFGICVFYSREAFAFVRSHQ